MAVSLLIRAPDAEAVQESPIILRLPWRRGVRQIRRWPSATISPTIRQRLHNAHPAAAPWASPVNDKVVRGREADRGYGLGYPTTLTGQLQSAVLHAGTPFAILQSRNRRFLPTCAAPSCSFGFFQQANARTIPAMVSDCRITTDMGKSQWLRAPPDYRRGSGTVQYVAHCRSVPPTTTPACPRYFPGTSSRPGYSAGPSEPNGARSAA